MQNREGCVEGYIQKFQYRIHLQINQSTVPLIGNREIKVEAVQREVYVKSLQIDGRSDTYLVENNLPMLVIGCKSLTMGADAIGIVSG